MALADHSDEQLAELLQAQGGVVALAKFLDIPQSTLSGHLLRRGLVRPQAERTGAHGGSKRTLPKISLEAIELAMQPSNNCRVKLFLEMLDEESRQVMEQALQYDKRDLPAPRLRETLVAQGFKDADVPGVDAINAHRLGQRPCRCKG